MILINLILINFIVWVYINETISDIPRKWIWRLFFNKKTPMNPNFLAKPLKCSCLAVYWNILYLLIIGKATLVWIAIVVGLYWIWNVVGDFLNLLKDLIVKLIDKCYDRIEN